MERCTCGCTFFPQAQLLNPLRSSLFTTPHPSCLMFIVFLNISNMISLFTMRLALLLSTNLYPALLAEIFMAISFFKNNEYLLFYYLIWSTSFSYENGNGLSRFIAHFLHYVAVWCSVSQFSHSAVSHSLWSHGLQHTRLPCPSPTPRAYSNSCP